MARVVICTFFDFELKNRNRLLKKSLIKKALKCI